MNFLTLLFAFLGPVIDVAAHQGLPTTAAGWVTMGAASLPAIVAHLTPAPASSPLKTT